MKVQGTMETVKPVEFDGIKVRVRTNIEKITKEDDKGDSYEIWEYDEEIITLEELQFRKIMGQV